MPSPLSNANLNRILKLLRQTSSTVLYLSCAIIFLGPVVFHVSNMDIANFLDTSNFGNALRMFAYAGAVVAMVVALIGILLQDIVMDRIRGIGPHSRN